MTSPSRSLSFFESGLQFATETLYSSAISCWATGSGAVDADQVREALHVLHDRHPFLRGRIEGEPGTYRFVLDVPFDSIPFLQVETSDPMGYNTVLEHQMNTPFPSSERLWEARLVHPPVADGASIDRWWLILVLHHAIADGRSAFNLLEECGAILGGIIRGEQPDRTSRPVPLSIEEEIDPTGTIERWNTVNQEWADQFGSITPWPTDGEAGYVDRHNHNTFSDHDPGFVRKLTDCCHREGTTVQGAFASAVACGIAAFRGQELDIDTVTPVDLRPHARESIPEGELACKITCLCTGSLNVSGNSEPWDIARGYTDELHRQLDCKVFPPLEFNGDDVVDFVNGFVNPPHRFNHGFCLTNSGLLPLKGDHGPIQFEAVDITASVRYGGFPILHSVYGYRGRIRCAYTWIEPLMSRDHALELTRSVESHLRTMAGEA